MREHDEIQFAKSKKYRHCVVSMQPWTLYHILEMKN